MKADFPKKSNKVTFGMGDTVPNDGDYVCVPCGFKMHFLRGDIFPECTSCLDDSEEYAKGFEAWEKAPPDIANITRKE